MQKKITDIMSSQPFTLSFEVFPPKKGNEQNLEHIFETVDELKVINPDFISVTFSSIGQNTDRSIKIAEYINWSAGLTSLSHMTCACFSKEDTDTILSQFSDSGFNNILALRGDIPPGNDVCVTNSDFRYAKDLIKYIKDKHDFCLAGAVYPEGHLEEKNINKNIEYALIKQESGVDFLISQLFFDNNSYYNFLDKTIQAGITVPIIPGIMPVLKVGQIKRMIELTGAIIPDDLQALLNKYGDDPAEMEKAGIEFAVSQINDLISSGVKSVHLYTMNKYKQIIEIVKKSSIETT